MNAVVRVTLMLAVIPIWFVSPLQTHTDAHAREPALSPLARAVTDRAERHKENVLQADQITPPCWVLGGYGVPLNIDNGPIFEFAPGVSATDRQLIRDGVEANMDWLRGRTGASVRNFLVFAFTSIQEYADHFGITTTEASRRAAAGIDLGFLQLDLRPPNTVGPGVLPHEFFHIVQAGLAKRCGGPDPRDQTGPLGPVWMAEGGAVFYETTFKL